MGFDLCPRLARLKKRRLYLPRGLDVPPILQPIVAETVSRRAIGRGWDGLLRLGASVKHGWYPATEALDRFGSAAAGDPVFEAGDALGKLLRTLYLCDFLSNPVFRGDVLDLLNQGEAVHSLQRAIHNAGITAKHGRTTEQLAAISGALTLLANVIMAWNTHRLQAVIDQALARQAAAPPRLLPVRAQRSPTRQSPARNPRRSPRGMTRTTTPEPIKSHSCKVSADGGLAPANLVRLGAIPQAVPAPRVGARQIKCRREQNSLGQCWSP